MKKNTLKKLNILISSLIIGVLSPVAYAGDNDIILSKLTGDVQNKFKAIGKNVHAMIAYQDSQPALSRSGIIPLGFELGANVSQINLQSHESMKEIGFDATSIPLPRLYAQVDIYSFGLAATYTPLFDGASITGYKLKYNILDGSTLLPALALNVAYSSLNGIDTLTSNAIAYNVGISKGFLFFTAYANLGVSQGTFTPNDLSFTLDKVKEQEFEAVLGGRLGVFGVANVGLQLHKLGENQSITLNFGAGF